MKVTETKTNTFHVTLLFKLFSFTPNFLLLGSWIRIRNTKYRYAGPHNNSVPACICRWDLFVGNISKRYSHSAVFYPASLAMFVFGGCTSSSSTFNDLWTLDLSTRTWARSALSSVVDLDPLVSGSGIIDPDSDPAKNEIADNKNVISNFIVNSGLCKL